MIYEGSPYVCASAPISLYRSDNHTRAVYVINEGQETIRLGSHQVTPDSGIPLAPGVMVVLELPHELAEDWYAVCVTHSLVSVTVLS